MNLDQSRDVKARTDWSDCTGQSTNKTSVYMEVIQKVKKLIELMRDKEDRAEVN